jgi:hypothetical protein
MESAGPLSTNIDVQAGREPHLFYRDAEVGLDRCVFCAG